MTAPHATAFLRIIDRGEGPVAYAAVSYWQRAKRTGQSLKRIGPVHVQAVRGGRGQSAWKPLRSRPPAGVLTRAEAESRLAEFAVLPSTTRTQSWAAACDVWLADCECQKCSPATMRDYRSTVKAHLREAFVKDADAVTADDVRELRAGLEAKGLATRTVAKTLVVAHGILAFAGVEPNPVAEAKPQERRTKARRAAKAAQEGAPPFFTGAEVATLIGQAPTERRADMISFAAQTGLRWGEIVGLRWGHVGGAWLEVQASYDKSGVTGPPKSGRERSVPLGQEAAAVLDRQHKLVPHEVGDLVFPHEDGGHERMDVSSSRGWFRALLNHTGLYVNQRGVHGLRHTFGTFGAHMVLPLTLQEWMGHADFTTTARYLHRVPPDTAPPDGFGEGWPVVLPPWLEGVQRAVQRTPLKST